MSEPENPPPPSSSSTSSSTKISSEHKSGNTRNSHGTYSGQKASYPNPPEITNPDAATLREQWRFAIRQYSKWYSHAWGTAILAGVSFFALGWVIKGSNPLPSFKTDHPSSSSSSAPPPTDATKEEDRR
ncbi:hypothetical protein Tsubulata_002064 [Turnera subulata]|uniref:Uncharacterized protein n=1 Tax=Turnera subulata TaxID=218843 RepID=A0A9Q0JH24_9ROSI|nr:hypothetical protein Tsubulata_002064 [Turnera subulata]